MGPLKRTMMITAMASFAALPAFADTFTSSASFNSAISGLSGTATANFDSDSTGNVANGTTVDGISFSYTPSVGTDSLAIVSTSEGYFDTTSEPNYLGTSDLTTAAFFPGDILSMSFASPVNALGLFIIGGPYNDGDFTLTDGSDTALSSSVLEETLGDGGQVIFLGITSATGFSGATLSESSSAGEIWNVDDITTAEGTPGSGGGGPPPVPEPGTFAFLALGLTVFARRVSKMRAPQADLFS